MKGTCVDTPMYLGPAKSRIIYEPRGIVAILGSWNYPIYTVLSPLVNAIAAGNTAIIKPSELSPFICKKLINFLRANHDSDSYFMLEGQIEVAKALTNAKVDMICFTGSTEKGKLVAEAAAKNLVPCLLELGGKSPLVVDSSASVSFAAKKIAMAKFVNSGQTCVAPDYVLCHYSVADKLISELKKAILD